MISSARITCWPPRVRVGGTISSLSVDQPLPRGLPGQCPTSPADQVLDTVAAKCEGIHPYYTAPPEHKLVPEIYAPGAIDEQ